MRWGLRTAGVMALLMATLAPSIGAQWPSYPTPGVPRTADGKPNLEAPAPRTADGKVDFSGIWMRGGAVAQVPRLARVARAAVAQATQVPRVRCRVRAWRWPGPPTTTADGIPFLSSSRSPAAVSRSRSSRGRRN